MIRTALLLFVVNVATGAPPESDALPKEMFYMG
jgi:hypothetical protein